MAGAPGIEPGKRGIKTRCLTAWLCPNFSYPERELVRTERLELSRREALEPKSSVSTNSTTSAHFSVKLVATARFELATPAL